MCMPKIRSEINDDAVHPIEARSQSSHGAGFLVKEAILSQQLMRAEIIVIFYMASQDPA